MFQPATIRSVGIEQRWNERQRDFHRVSGMVVRPSDPACTQLGVAKDSNDHSKRPVSGGVSSGKNKSDPRQPSMRASVVYRRAVVLLGNRRDWFFRVHCHSHIEGSPRIKRSWGHWHAVPMSRYRWEQQHRGGLAVAGVHDHAVQVAHLSARHYFYCRLPASSGCKQGGTNDGGKVRVGNRRYYWVYVGEPVGSVDVEPVFGERGRRTGRGQGQAWSGNGPH